MISEKVVHWPVTFRGSDCLITPPRPLNPDWVYVVFIDPSDFRPKPTTVVQELLSIIEEAEDIDIPKSLYSITLNKSFWLGDRRLIGSPAIFCFMQGAEADLDRYLRWLSEIMAVNPGYPPDVKFYVKLVKTSEMLMTFAFYDPDEEDDQMQEGDPELVLLLPGQLDTVMMMTVKKRSKLFVF